MNLSINLLMDLLIHSLYNSTIYHDMGRMTDILKEYLANASKGQIAKDWEELKVINDFGVDVMDFLAIQEASIHYNMETCDEVNGCYSGNPTNNLAPMSFC